MRCDSPFLDHCTNVAKGFLQTAVVVDDRAYLYQTERPAPLAEPTRGVGSSTTGAGRLAASPPGYQHDLDAKGLIDAFAEAGLVCAVLRPKLASQEGSPPADRESIVDVASRTTHATHRADIVIVDWRLRDESEVGRAALELIRRILSDDIGGGRKAADGSSRLRLIAIYTGEPDLRGIATKVEEFLKENGCRQARCDGFEVTAGRIRIPVFAKAGGMARIGDEAARQVGEKDLPGRLIQEFARANQGLLANVALASLGALRDSTHLVLGKFTADLDPAYVAHRALLVPPEDAQPHPIPLLAAEFESILYDADVSAHVSQDAIGKWLTSQRKCGLNLESKLEGLSGDQVEEVLRDLIGNGLEAETLSKKFPSWSDILTQIKEQKDKKVLSSITNILTPDDVDGCDKDKEFALLMSTRTRYGQPPPQLTLGTVVRHNINKNPQYLLCVQPRCDSFIRKGEERAFLFLRLIESGDFSIADVVIRDRRKVKSFKVDLKPYEIRQIKFQVEQDETIVRSYAKGPGWAFKTAGDPPDELTWIADLRRDHAQRIVNRLAARMSRVGLTESEWLRRMAKGGGRSDEE